MHRVGFSKNNLDTFIERLRSSETLVATSVFSHLATADCPGMEDFTRQQIDLFERMSVRLMSGLNQKIKRHLLNTAGIATLGDTPAAYDMARLGIGLYGISPVSCGRDKGLRMTARLVSTIISLNILQAGETVGYGRKGVVNRESTIATLPVGYADGIDRRLGNGNAKFIVDGMACPVIGNICMDLLMLDVTDAVKAGKKVEIGTEVEIFGPEAPVEKLAETLGTIPYEILTSVSPRVRRTYHHR